MNSYFFPEKQHKYRAYISSTLQLVDCKNEILDPLVRARLLYYSPEEAFVTHARFKDHIQREMQDSDIFILICTPSQLLDGQSREMLLASKLEYDLAKQANLPILAYFTQENLEDLFDESGDSFPLTARKDETCTIISSEGELPALIVTDIFRVVLGELNLSSWVRSDINSAKLDSIVQQKNLAYKNFSDTSLIIQRYENYLRAEERDQIIGPLVDVGLRPNISKQAYRFAVPQSPKKELTHSDLKYQYYLDRFLSYQCGAVYDRKLDKTWFLIPSQTFPWQEANNWRENIKPDTLKNFACLHASPNLENDKDWRLPTIEELISLLTATKQGDDYFDKLVFPGSLHWFWSSTVDPSDGKAYYIETTQGKILKDETGHFKAVLLCTDGRPENLGEMIHLVSQDTNSWESDLLVQASRARHIYGIFISVCAKISSANQLLDILQPTLFKSGYAITTTLSTSSSRTFLQKEDIRKNMEIQDGYVLVIDRSADPELLDLARYELMAAQEFGVQIFIYHNTPDIFISNYRSKLGPIADELTFARYKDPMNLAKDIVVDLNKGIERTTSLGWIRDSAFASINQNIEKINQIGILSEESEIALRNFISKCNIKGLQEAFENCGTITGKPTYGEQVWFVSRDTPITRLFSQPENGSNNFPVLFEKLLDRFELVEEGDDYAIVKDNYLNLHWWTLGIKKTSYNEALEYAEKISGQRNEHWRLPTIEEMVTLLTRNRVNRKYMDEVIFPKGRWFWTASQTADLLYYIDYNYLQGSVNREKLSNCVGEIQAYSKKTVMLVSDLDKKMSRKSSRQIVQKSTTGGKAMDTVAVPILMQTVEFLFGEASKILAERREKRKTPKDVVAEQSASTIPPGELEQPTNKQDLIAANIIPEILRDKQSEIEHLNNVLRRQTKNYYILEQQIAGFTEMEAPVHKIAQRDDVVENMKKTMRQLEAILGSVYGRKVKITDLDE
jgi:hypothetical protein